MKFLAVNTTTPKAVVENSPKPKLMSKKKSDTTEDADAQNEAEEAPKKTNPNKKLKTTNI